LLKEVSQNVGETKGDILFLTHTNRFTGLPDIDILRCAGKSLPGSATNAAKIYQTELAYAATL
jgi:hypothetical protein